MQLFEYSVIPAPDRGEKARGAKTGAERFSLALTTTLNEMAAQGWEYIRAETLPAEERTGLTGRATVYHNVLVFRRALALAEPEWQPATQQHLAPDYVAEARAEAQDAALIDAPEVSGALPAGAETPRT